MSGWDVFLLSGYIVSVLVVWIGGAWLAADEDTDTDRKFYAGLSFLFGLTWPVAVPIIAVIALVLSPMYFFRWTQQREERTR